MTYYMDVSQFLLNVVHLPPHTLRYGNYIRDFFGLYYFNVTVPGLCCLDKSGNYTANRGRHMKFNLYLRFNSEGGCAASHEKSHNPLYTYCHVLEPLIYLV